MIHLYKDGLLTVCSAAVGPMVSVDYQPCKTEMVRVFQDYSYDVDDSLIGHIQFLAGLLEKIPEEYKQKAKIEISSDYESSTEIKVYYERTLSEKEINEKIREERERKERYEKEKLADELRQYERLKKKFDAPS